MSIETAPPVERLYILLQADDLESRQVSALASGHLASLGWQMEPDSADAAGWYDFVSRGSARDETAYVGPLVDYLDSGLWASDDEGAPEELRRLAGSDLDSVVVVQLFARGG